MEILTGPGGEKLGEKRTSVATGALGSGSVGCVPPHTLFCLPVFLKQSGISMNFLSKTALDLYSESLYEFC